MRTMMMITIAVLMTMTMAKSDEPKTLTDIANDVKQLPQTVSSWGKSEWEKTKAYQKQGWAEAKTKWPWNQIFKSEAE